MLLVTQQQYLVETRELHHAEVHQQSNAQASPVFRSIRDLLVNMTTMDKEYKIRSSNKFMKMIREIFLKFDAHE